MFFHSGKYQIEIVRDVDYSPRSADNVHNYDVSYHHLMREEGTAVFFGIRVFQDDAPIRSAVIYSNAAYCGINEHSVIIEEDRIVISCTDTLFCLTLPELQLLWATAVDPGCCFEIFKHGDGYITHGELTISRVSHEGRILWQHHGGDIFTNLDGTSIFTINDDHIYATDWAGNEYKLDFDGKSLE